MDKNVEDYLEYEYEDKNSKMTINPVLSAVVGKTKQAIKNRIEKEKIQQQLLNDTAERYGLGKDEIDDFLFKSYEDEDSCEYLVDGAILTCTNCTRENVYVKDEKASSDLVTVEKAYLAELDPSIDDSMFPDNDIKVYKRLKVTENLTANSNGLMHATIKDCIVENNIPSFGNCLSGPNCARENEIFQDEEATEKKGGTCQFLMRLESEWENYEIGQSFQSFDDDVEGKQIGITMTSTLFCKHGGFIYPVTSGQVLSSLDDTEKFIKEVLETLEWPIDENEVHELKAILDKFGITDMNSIACFLLICRSESGAVGLYANKVDRNQKPYVDQYGRAVTEYYPDGYEKKVRYIFEERGVGYIQVTWKLTQLACLQNLKNKGYYKEDIDDNALGYVEELREMPWAVSAWRWAVYEQTGEHNLNKYVEARGDDNGGELTLGMVLVAESFINGKVSKENTPIQDTSSNITPQQEYSTMNDAMRGIATGSITEWHVEEIKNVKTKEVKYKLHVAGWIYDAPNNWAEFEANYNKLHEKGVH